MDPLRDISSESLLQGDWQHTLELHIYPTSAFSGISLSDIVTQKTEQSQLGL